MESKKDNFVTKDYFDEKIDALEEKILALITT